MNVILLDELRGKGGEGDVIDVAQGYAENFLFPQGIAQPATPGNIKQLEERRHNIEKREEKRIADAQAVKEKLDGQAVTVEARIGEEGQLFGSVTAPQIADAVAAQLGVEIDRKRVVLGQPIKVAGRHEVEVNLYRDINASLAVLVGVEAALEADEAAEDADELEVADDAEAVAEAAEAVAAEAEAETE